MAMCQNQRDVHNRSGHIDAMTICITLWVGWKDPLQLPGLYSILQIDGTYFTFLYYALSKCMPDLASIMIIWPDNQMNSISFEF